MNLFTCAVLALFAWSSWQFVQFEIEDQTIAFANVPAWMCEIIMPVGAGIMALRYALQVIKPK
ncbi:MAG: TRAP transporter small permease subunit [Pseudomonadota bacterium]